MRTFHSSNPESDFSGVFGVIAMLGCPAVSMFWPCGKDRKFLWPKYFSCELVELLL